MLDIETLTTKLHDRKVAILFVDMQLGYMNDVFGSGNMLNGTERLLDESAGKVECVHIGCGVKSSKPSYGDTVLKKRNPFINQDLNSLASIYLYEIPRGQPICLKDKFTANGFDNTGLADYLREQGIDTVMVCGIYDEFCVRDTGEGAQKLGFNVVYLSDLIRGHLRNLHSPDAAEQLAIHQAMYADSGLVIQSKDLKPILDAMPARTQRAVTANQSYAELSVPAAN